MALDTVVLNPGAGGDSIGVDNIGGADYEVVKQAFGVEGDLNLVSTSVPLPVTDNAAELSLASIDLKLTNPLPVSTGGLTDVQLRATPVPISGTVSTGLTQPLTDTQLRAVPVPVSISGGGGGAVTIADGADITEGAIADAVVAAGAAGTISAKLRRTTQGLEDLKTGIVLASGTNVIGHVINDASAAVIGHVINDAGAAIIGKVGIDQTTPGTTNGVQVNAALPAGANVIGHVIVDASGAVIGHVIVDSGTITAVTAITNALPVGSNVIGKTSIDQTTPGTTNLVALTAETTKAIGVIRNSDGAGNLLTSNSTTFSAKFGLDANLLGTLGTAFSTAGKVDIKSTQKPSIGATVVMTVTNLQSLASSATAGWQSLRVSNLATLANDYEIFVKLTTANTAPGSDKAAYVFICPFYTTDAGSTWFASSQGTATLPTGTEGTTTIASPHNLRLLGVLNYSTAQMVLQDTFLLSNCFGNRMPDGFSIIIINFTGAALSTGCVVDYSPINDILV